MNKYSFSQSSMLYLELLFLIALIFPPLVESVRVLGTVKSSLEHEYTEIMTKAVNPSILPAIMQAIIALGMFLQFKIEKKNNFPFFLPCVFLLIYLVINSFFWNWITQIQGMAIFQLQEIQIQNLFLMIIATTFAAFYEEIVYRWYGPKVLHLLFVKKKQEEESSGKKGLWVRIICLEALLIAIFGLSHGYGGWTAVGNALIAGLGLRLCTIKTESPLPSFFAHLAYNFFQFFLLLK